MYLSRVRVATSGLDQSALTKLLQANAYGNHQLLWRLFPDETERPFLFRQELESESTLAEGQPRGLPLFYVLSRTEPVDVPGLLSCEIKPFQPRLHSGQHLAFRLRANPCVARKDEGARNSRRHDVLMDAKKTEQQRGTRDREALHAAMDRAAVAWLSDELRAERAGYRLVSEPQVEAYQQHTYRNKGRRIRFSSVDYQGLLEVVDPERFQATLAEGIGHSRAFGCGMWLIRRAK
ncbi:MAG: type I-E CRISPR-associated protein Cas6/Cse3/CasE [Spiribacter salinus]|uniref:Type I-E CRISPR-associated protein Cas6/Cse3/CasE n=1 Tax=Spiribacter salinus TaxID=1335746 RepID=A0A540VQK3_9GAMM|nr:MAG: type I-E CRISPR-associated protein Cas6/Cse3/CasE [Spiribacter salinus]